MSQIGWFCRLATKTTSSSVSGRGPASESGASLKFERRDPDRDAGCSDDQSEYQADCRLSARVIVVSSMGHVTEWNLFPSVTRPREREEGVRTKERASAQAIVTVDTKVALIDFLDI